jgi:hypothetical protein
VATHVLRILLRERFQLLTRLLRLHFEAQSLGVR